ncbi:DUF6368 family protein [Spirillospora sp. NPDC052269]
MRSHPPNTPPSANCWNVRRRSWPSRPRGPLPRPRPSPPPEPPSTVRPLTPWTATRSDRARGRSERWAPGMAGPTLVIDLPEPVPSAALHEFRESMLGLSSHFEEKRPGVFDISVPVTRLGVRDRREGEGPSRCRGLPAEGGSGEALGG